MGIILDTTLDCKNSRNITNLAQPNSQGEPLVFQDNYYVINQNAHGFAVGDLVRNNGSIWVKGDAQNQTNLPTHVVAKVLDSNNFSPVNIGVVTKTSHGITPGNPVYASDTSGNISGIAGTISYVIGRAITANQISFNFLDKDLNASLDTSSFIKNNGNTVPLNIGTHNATSVSLFTNYLELIKLNHDTAKLELKNITELANPDDLVSIDTVTGAIYTTPKAYLVPPGTIITVACTNPPVNWRLLLCDGSALSRTTYSDLWAIAEVEITAGNQLYGAGDGSTTFTIPDLRAEVIRGWDSGRGVDTGRVAGSWQNATRVYKDNAVTGWSAGTARFDGLISADQDGATEVVEQSNNIALDIITRSSSTNTYNGVRVRVRNVAIPIYIKY